VLVSVKSFANTDANEANVPDNKEYGINDDFIVMEDGSPVSIFTFDCVKQRDKLPLAKNAFKKFRTIRHPDLLRYVDGVETDSNIYIVTENVTPLSTQLNTRSDDNLVSWAGEWKLAGFELMSSPKEDNPVIFV
ncbi:5058_t:CDS:2, partial [Racocetra fulgida]